jgi:CheY-like chemotaxis protein
VPITKENLRFKKFRPSGFDELCRGKKLVIVCAEDSYYNMETLRITFYNIGLENKCKFVTDGQQAIDICLKVATSSLDEDEDLVLIVIMDHVMPIKSGIEAFKEIRAFFEHHNACCVNKADGDDERLSRRLRKPTYAMFSAYQFTTFRAHALKSGFDYNLQKPPDQQEIVNLVMNSLRKASFD